jgi:hypothetical protein
MGTVAVTMTCFIGIFRIHALSTIVKINFEKLLDSAAPRASYWISSGDQPMNKLVVLKDSKTGKITHRIIRQLPHDHKIKLGDRLIGGVVQGIAEVG